MWGGGTRAFKVEKIGNTHSSRRAGEREFFESWVKIELETLKFFGKMGTKFSGPLWAVLLQNENFSQS